MNNNHSQQPSQDYQQQHSNHYHQTEYNKMTIATPNHHPGVGVVVHSPNHSSPNNHYQQQQHISSNSNQQQQQQLHSQQPSSTYQSKIALSPIKAPPLSPSSSSHYSPGSNSSTTTNNHNNHNSNNINGNIQSNSSRGSNNTFQPSFSLSPIRKSQHTSPTSYFNANNGSGGINGGINISEASFTTLSQTKTSKKEAEKAYQSLLSRIKFLEEEEKRKGSKLLQYDYLNQKHEESKKLKKSMNELVQKRKELDMKLLEEKTQIVSSIKDSRLNVKERVKTFELEKKLETCEFRKRIDFFKDLHKDQKNQLSQYNSNRRNEIKELNERLKEENRIKKEEFAKQKNLQRQQSKIHNENLYHERERQILQMKEQVVNQIKSQRIGYDYVQQARIQQSQDIVSQHLKNQIERDFERTRHIEKSINQLKIREEQARRRLEFIERKLLSSSPTNSIDYSNQSFINMNNMNNMNGMNGNSMNGMSNSMSSGNGNGMMMSNESVSATLNNSPRNRKLRPMSLSPSSSSNNVESNDNSPNNTFNKTRVTV